MYFLDGWRREIRSVECWMHAGHEWPEQLSSQYRSNAWRKLRNAMRHWNASPTPSQGRVSKGEWECGQGSEESRLRPWARDSEAVLCWQTRDWTQIAAAFGAKKLHLASQETCQWNQCQGWNAVIVQGLELLMTGTRCSVYIVSFYLGFGNAKLNNILTPVFVHRPDLSRPKLVALAHPDSSAKVDKCSWHTQKSWAAKDGCLLSLVCFQPIVLIAAKCFPGLEYRKSRVQRLGALAHEEYANRIPHPHTHT